MVTPLEQGPYWVGAVDRGLRRLPGHELSTRHRGSSNNACLEHLARCNIPVIRKGIRCKWRPGTQDMGGVSRIRAGSGQGQQS
jgi:hypothetical protein